MGLRRQRDNGEVPDEAGLDEDELIGAGAPASRTASFLHQFGIETSRPLRAHAKAHNFLRIWGMVFGVIAVYCFLVAGYVYDSFDGCAVHLPISGMGGYLAGGVAGGGVSVLLFGLARVSVQLREQYDDTMSALRSDD